MRVAPVLGVCGVVLLVSCLSPYLLPSAYLAVAGVVADGEVTAKQESILMPGSDRWRHVLEVTYRYQPSGSARAETGVHQVGASLYSKLRIGSAVKVVYSPWPLLRSLHIVAMGSALAESTWLSRLPLDGDTLRGYLDLASVIVAVALAVIAWRRKSRGWNLAAVFCAAIVFSAVLPMGFLVFPILLWMWRARHGEGYGWILLASLPLSAAVLYCRMPHPPPEPPGPSRETIAVVRSVRVVDHIWSDSENPGQDVRQPFQMADLEFTPAGASEPVHALDRVDLYSVPSLRDGARVPVVYSIADPRSARIAGGTRAYAKRALIYILELTYGITAVLMLVVLPALALADRLLQRVKGVVTGVSREGVVERLSQLPPDDPRRKALEGFLRAGDRAK